MEETGQRPFFAATTEELASSDGEFYVVYRSMADCPEWDLPPKKSPHSFDSEYFIKNAFLAKRIDKSFLIDELPLTQSLCTVRNLELDNCDIDLPIHKNSTSLLTNKSNKSGVHQATVFECCYGICTGLYAFWVNGTLECVIRRHGMDIKSICLCSNHIYEIPPA